MLCVTSTPVTSVGKALATSVTSLLAWIAILCAAENLIKADEPSELQLAKRLADRVLVILANHCTECHSTTIAEADIDLSVFQSLADVKRQLEVWQKVAEMLATHQMPPQDAIQPSAEDAQELQAWVQSMLKHEARRSAGDPGPPVLRRLNNAEYTFTIQDLTGLNLLKPAQEFPADGGAGEGFTNAGNAQSMSPALLSKYLDAAKAVAAHAVLLPQGVRFSEFTTRRDWTEEVLAEIRNLYATYSAKTGETRVNLQGIMIDTNDGGRLPVEAYLRATLEERSSLIEATKTLDEVARERGLSSKYLKLLWETLTTNQPATQLLNDLKVQWQTSSPEDAPHLTAQIARWQQTLWSFASVGHIGKVNGPKAWMEAINPLADRQEVRLKIPTQASDGKVSIYLATGDAGDGNEQDVAIWEQPRLVAPGRPDILLCNVRRMTTDLAQHREETFQVTAKCLAAATEVSGSKAEFNLEDLAEKYQVPTPALQAWLEYLGIASQGPVRIAAPLSRTITSTAGYDFIQGWVGDDALSVLANSSNSAVRIPGNMKPHSVAVHPSPSRRVAVGWQSPVAATLRIEGSVQHAHPECGNGVAWVLELRRGNTRQRLATGDSQGANVVNFGPFDSIAVQPGDLVSLIIDPRDANHSCDLTSIDLSLASEQETWNLAQDVSPDILKSNPHADRNTHDGVWHFYSEPTSGGTDYVLPAGSLLARWQATSDERERQAFADKLQELLLNNVSPKDLPEPDNLLRQQLTSVSGPLLSVAFQTIASRPSPEDDRESSFGLPASMFGTHPLGESVDRANLCVTAPSVIEVVLPSDFVAGYEFVATGRLDSPTSKAGSVQFEVLTEAPASMTGLQAIDVTTTGNDGTWTSNNRRVSMSNPIIVSDSGAAKQRWLSAFEDFRQLFPVALCYTKIVPVDEVVTLTLYYREDEHLKRLMLSDAESDQLARLWNELHFTSQDALLSLDAFEQLWQFATQDADPSAFEPLREPLKQRAATFRETLLRAEPTHIEFALRFAEQAFRRPLSAAEEEGLRTLYRDLRADELNHEDSLRLILAKILVSPAFLYRMEIGNGETDLQEEPNTRRVSENELASRLSYFLWSSAPDEQLKTLAREARLHDPTVLHEQVRRMLGDARSRRLATEFACQWLQIYEFDLHDEKSETVFPTFADLRGPMYEESIRYFTDWFQRDGTLLELLDSNYTFVNPALAEHYGIEGVHGADWQRVVGNRAAGRGGILTMATTLSKQAGASRTSPILRGNWISEVILGERLPRPPKNVPPLPDSLPAGLTERQLIEQHSSDPACARCHTRIDPFGFALEGFDAIGRSRSGPKVNTLAELSDGTELAGLQGLKDYLLNQRRHDFARQFCKKILGYALGRAVQLSDEVLLDDMQQKLAANDYRVTVAIDSIVNSPQFLRLRVE
jgi:mono/diheme cytochrome c family protein/AraC-like DNA-binding protein